MICLRCYRPDRIYLVFHFLLSIFLIIKRKERLLFWKPLSPIGLKTAIIQLGSSFVKLAQVLATRSDFFSPAYLDQLKELHDELPPMRPREFQTVFRSAFPTSPFAEFNEQPIASASIGQVHTATLHSGEHVAVKLRRGQIRAQVRSDIFILRSFNRLFRPLFSHYTKHSIESLIAEFSRMILQEVSLTKELDNLQQFTHAYADCGVRFPTPYPELCSDGALVMSFEEGFRFDDKKQLTRHDIPFRITIEKVVDFYVEQMLIQGYFHADPHPGNLLVKPDGSLVLLDFGMVKRIGHPTRIAIIEIIKSANEQDFENYIKACKKLGVVADEAPDEEMQLFAARMFEIFNSDHLDSTSMQNLAFEVLASMNDLPFKLPQEAIYILRVSAIIEGLGTTYIENFNGIKDILPILKRNIPRALGLEGSLSEMLFSELQKIPISLQKSHQVLERLEAGSLEVKLAPATLERLELGMRRYLRGIVLSFAIMLGAIGILLSGLSDTAGLLLLAIGFLGILYNK